MLGRRRCNTTQAKRLADERKVSHVHHRNAKRDSISTKLRAAAYARESVRSLLPEGR
jgi:hypothetical protein